MPFFKNESLNIYYEVAGMGPALLLINGLGGDTRAWGPLINCLKDSFTVVSYDMRSAGKSDKPADPFAVSDLAGEALALINHLGHKKISVLGFSLGGMIAMTLALNHPYIIDKLFLVSTVPSFRRPYPMKNEARELFKRTDVSEKLLSDVYKIIFGKEFKKKIPARDFVAFRLSDENPQPADAYLSQLSAVEGFDIYNDVQKIKAPACVIVGEDDNVFPMQNSVWLHEHISGSKFFQLKGVGHMAIVEAPDEIAKVVKFFGDVPQSVNV